MISILLIGFLCITFDPSNVFLVLLTVGIGVVTLNRLSQHIQQFPVGELEETRNNWEELEETRNNWEELEDEENGESEEEA